MRSSSRPLPAALVALALVGLVALGSACSKDEKGKSGAAAPRATSAPAPPAITFTITGVDANGTKEPDEATIAAVKAALDRWAALAVTAPLRTGQPAADLSPVFTAAALERLADAETRVTLVDEGLPPATRAVTASAATATLSSVAGPDEVIAVIGASIRLDVRATGPGLDVDIVHAGELVLHPEGDVWKIESFVVHTTRDSRDAPDSRPTTTATSP